MTLLKIIATICIIGILQLFVFEINQKNGGLLTSLKRAL